MYVDENTLFKAYKALTRCGLSDDQALDVVNEVMNAGVYFREAPPPHMLTKGGIMKGNISGALIFASGAMFGAALVIFAQAPSAATPKK